ncbi:MAG: phage head closure protein, partial [Planctomycetes bacterium]|nr:phage head closure protein [Planctomycetota bacterium]
MRSGRLRHLVTIQNKQVLKNTYGEEEVTWVEEGKAWAEIEGVSGAEYVASSAEQSGITNKIEMRRYDGLRPDMRITYRGRIFDVLSVLDK